MPTGCCGVYVPSMQQKTAVPEDQQQFEALLEIRGNISYSPRLRQEVLYALLILQGGKLDCVVLDGT